MKRSAPSLQFTRLIDQLRECLSYQHYNFKMSIN
jgi:hypothetical protein